MIKFARMLGPVAAAAIVVAGLPAAAQEFPSQPVTMIVPYSAGSTTDIIARHIAEPLSQVLGQPVVVENRTGAGGAVGVTALMTAPADGHTIGLIVSGNVIQPWMQEDVNFDVRTDFENMSLMYAGQYVLSVRPDFPAQTFDAFMEYARDNPQDVFYGSSGTGTTTHLAGEMLMQQSDLELSHIPFQGSPQVLAAILSGEVQAYFDLYGSTKPNIDNGSVHPIAVSGQSRLPALPDVPAIAETLPDFTVLAWTGFAAPKGTPPEIVERLTEELREIMNSPTMQTRFEELGVEPGGNSPDEFNQFVEDQFEMWGRTIQAAGFTPQ